MIIVKGEGCWLVSHIDDYGYPTYQAFPESMSIEEVKFAWTENVLRGEITTVTGQYKYEKK